MTFARKYSEELREKIRQAYQQNRSLSYRELANRFSIPSTRTIFDVLHSDEKRMRNLKKNAVETLNAIIDILDKTQSDSDMWPYDIAGLLLRVIFKQGMYLEDILDIGVPALIWIKDMGLITLKTEEGRELIVMNSKKDWNQTPEVYHDLQDYENGGGEEL